MPLSRIGPKRPIVSLSHLEDSLKTNSQNNKAHVLKAIIFRYLGREPEAADALDALLAADPLDHWGSYESVQLSGGGASTDTFHPPWIQESSRLSDAHPWEA